MKVKIANKATSESELQSMVDRLGIRDFHGFYSRDELKDIPLKKGFYIINYDTRDGRGTHWAVLEMQTAKKGFYASSFGDPPLEALNSTKVNISYNNIDVQSLSSQMCGYFCIAYMLLRNRGVPFKQIWSDYFISPDNNSDVSRGAEARRFRNNATLIHLLTKYLR